MESNSAGWRAVDVEVAIAFILAEVRVPSVDGPDVFVQRISIRDDVE